MRFTFIFQGSTLSHVIYLLLFLDIFFLLDFSHLDPQELWRSPAEPLFLIDLSESWNCHAHTSRRADHTSFWRNNEVPYWAPLSPWSHSSLFPFTNATSITSFGTSQVWWTIFDAVGDGHKGFKHLALSHNRGKQQHVCTSGSKFEEVCHCC